MIYTLSFTIVIEGLVALGYSVWRRKPACSILLTSFAANLITQSLLWVALTIFFQNYLLTLFVSEILIWLVEGMLLFVIRPNRLSVMESLLLSLFMNLSSFTLGWWLPI